MNENTKRDYQRLAEHFYKRLDGPPTPKKLADELKKCAGEYRPTYWRRLKNAIAYDQERQGYGKAVERIRDTKRPPGAIPPRQRRAKGASLEDTERLTSDLVERGDREAWAAVTLARYTGARPAEMPGIVVAGDQVIIEGVKKSHGGNRGADRVIELTDADALDQVREAAEVLTGANMGRIQDRVRAAGRRLWPQRKAVPSLYSWRHQVGSDLKASGLDRRSIAYLMGHQSTQSVEVYGRRNRGGSSPLKVAQGADLSGVRENHREPPSVQVTPKTNLDQKNKNEDDRPSFGFSAPGPARSRSYGRKGP